MAVRRFGLLFLVFLCWGTIGYAETSLLDGPSITQVLKGNTLKGTRPNGTPWSQYFSENGVTLYREEGAEVQNGRWTVRDDEYCSKWPPSEYWSCYRMKGDILIKPAHIMWLFSNGDEWHGLVVSGRKL